MRIEGDSVRRRPAPAAIPGVPAPKASIAQDWSRVPGVLEPGNPCHPYCPTPRRTQRML